MAGSLSRTENEGAADERGRRLADRKCSARPPRAPGVRRRPG